MLSFRCILCIYYIVIVSVPSCDAWLHVDGRRSPAAGSGYDFGAGQETTGARRARAATGIAASFARFSPTLRLLPPARSQAPLSSPPNTITGGMSRTERPRQPAAHHPRDLRPRARRIPLNRFISLFRWT